MSEGAPGAICVGLALLLSGPSTAVPAEQVPTEGRILATYQVNLAAFSLGEFTVDAQFKGSAYELKGEGRFSLFLGRTYKSSGSTESEGRFAKGGLEPSSFKLSVKNGDKREARRMSFARGAVSEVTFIPKKKIGKRRVPVTEDQLIDVLDPLSAAFLHMPAGAPVCDATMPVYDGLLRFDLVLTPKRDDHLPNEAPPGLSGPAAVCNVNFSSCSRRLTPASPDSWKMTFFSSRSMKYALPRPAAAGATAPVTPKARAMAPSTRSTGVPSCVPLVK